MLCAANLGWQGHALTSCAVLTGAFFSNWLAIILSTLIAQGFGQLVGATVMVRFTLVLSMMLVMGFPNTCPSCRLGITQVPKTAQTLVSVIMLSMMLVGTFNVLNSS